MGKRITFVTQFWRFGGEEERKREGNGSELKNCLFFSLVGTTRQGKEGFEGTVIDDMEWNGYLGCEEDIP